MVVYLRHDGDQSQTSVYLDYRTHLHPGIHRVQDWIVRNPGSDISLDSLADVAAVSRRHLTRLFRRLTGISIKEYSTRVRLELARALINDPALTVDAVAQRSGLGSARHLRRLWRVHSERRRVRNREHENSLSGLAPRLASPAADRVCCNNHEPRALRARGGE